jgi:hypothetical protein
MPNLYAMLAYSEQGLVSYLQLQSRKQLLSKRESVIISLVVGAIHQSDYCMGIQAMIARLNGFDDEQIREVKGNGNEKIISPHHPAQNPKKQNSYRTAYPSAVVHHQKYDRGVSRTGRR